MVVVQIYCKRNLIFNLIVGLVDLTTEAVNTLFFASFAAVFFIITEPYHTLFSLWLCTQKTFVYYDRIIRWCSYKLDIAFDVGFEKVREKTPKKASFFSAN